MAGPYPIDPNASPNDSSLVSQLLTEVRVLATRVEIVLENQAKFEKALNAFDCFCRDTRIKHEDRITAVETWKATKNGVEAERQRQSETEAINKPQWHQAAGIYLAIPIGIISLIIALISYFKG